MKKIIFITFMGLILLGFVMAADWTPTGNINLRNVYNITNVPYINGTNANFTMYYGNGSQLTGVVADPSPHNDLSGLQGGNTSEYYHLNSTVWNRIMAYAYSWVYDLSSYYTSSQVDAINASVGNYISSNNQSVNNYIVFVNGTAAAYTNAVSLSYNESNNNYILYTNGTMQSYVDAVNTAINNSNNNYALVLNTSNNNYIVFTNGTMKSYVDLQDILFNDSINNWITQNNNSVNNYISSNNQSVVNTLNLYVLITTLVDRVGNWTLDKVNYYTSSQVDGINTSQTNYGNWQNTSVTNSITANNNSVNSYISSNNGSIVNYISTVNTSMRNYVDGTFITQASEGDLNVNSSTWWAEVSGWVSGWLIKTGDNLEFNETKFNETLDNKLIGEHWFFTEDELTYGTSEGTLSLTNQFDDYDSISYNLTETTPQGLEYYANTSNNITTDMNRICIRYKATGDNFVVSLYSISLGTWEVYMTLYGDTIFNWLCKEIRDPSDHLVDDKIMVRIIHVGSASLQHKLQIDAMYVSSGYTPRIGNEVDPVSFHINENLNNTGYNITADYFFGNGSQLNGVLKSESDPYWTGNYTSYNASWSSTYNSTYNLWAYNQTIPAIQASYNGTLFLTSQWNSTNTSIDWNSLTHYPVACPAGSYVTQIDDSITCTTVVETNWNANFTAFNDSWSYTFNQTTNDSITNSITANNASVNSYISSNNQSIVNWANNIFVSISSLVDRVGNWSADKSDYSTTTQANNLYYGINNPSGFYNSTSNIGNWTLDKSSYTLLSVLNNGSYFNPETSDTFIANYSVFLTHATQTYVDNQNTSQTNDMNSRNLSITNSIASNNVSVTNTFGLYTLITTLVDRVGNWSLDKINYYTKTDINNFNDSYLSITNTSYMTGENFTLQNTSMRNYVINANTTLYQILNNGSYFNTANGEPRWDANYSLVMTMANATIQNQSLVNYIGVQNTSMKNYADSQDVLFNTSQNNYIAQNNASVVNWVNAVFAKITDLSAYVTWSGIWAQVYNETEVNAINTSMKNYADTTMTAQNTSQTNAMTAQNTSQTNHINTKLNLAGGTMTGNLNISNDNNVSSVNCIIFKSGGKICSGI